uniref:Uncharacterized protein n=1 Tax=Arundo donax TaxID=35708 RepID=A0A0A8ZJT5_ARUDO
MGLGVDSFGSQDDDVHRGAIQRSIAHLKDA